MYILCYTTEYMYVSRACAHNTYMEFYLNIPEVAIMFGCAMTDFSYLPERGSLRKSNNFQQINSNNCQSSSTVLTELKQKNFKE